MIILDLWRLHDVYRALLSGAEGYVLRESVAQDSPLAVETVMANDRDSSQWLNDMLVNDGSAESSGAR